MKFGIEEVKTKHNTRLIIISIVFLLLALFVAIMLGVWTAKALNTPKTQEMMAEKQEDKMQPKNTLDEKQIKAFVAKINNIYNEKGKTAFLTFDDGPSKTVTPHILSTLKKHKIKATFFVIGNRIADNKELLKREYNEGHYIANHGYSHRYDKIYSSSSKVLEEYNKTEKAIQKALENREYNSHLFRFPGGSVGGTYDKVKSKSKKELNKKGIAYLDWNALTSDSAGAKTKKEIIKNLKETVKNKNNVVILMHDAPDKEITYKTLEDVIKYLKKEGYSFKNMYDLI